MTARHTHSFSSALTCLAFLFLFATRSNAQTIRGTLLDESDHKPVPFAAVILGNSNTGTTADLDGNFNLKITNNAAYLSFRMFGYTTRTVSVASLDLNGNNSIYLSPNGVKLSEIEIRPGENPALAVISKVIENKPRYDIANLPHYYCSTYSKTYFTLSDENGDEDYYMRDTARFRDTRKVLERTYLFFIESVTEKKYRYKNIAQEKVLASKTSGFKKSIFGTFASQLQSFTFYEDNISLLGINYVNPLSKGTFKRYNFEITDTILHQSDTTLLIRFYPKRPAKFAAMKGVLYINKNNYVLTNVLAEPNDITNSGHGIRIQQLYSKADSTHWFPKQLNTEMLFDSQKDGAVKQMIKAVSRQYISNVQLDSNIAINRKNVTLLESEDVNKDDAYWNSQRHDSLSRKETESYRIIDSVSQKMKLEKKALMLSALANGRYPLGYADLDLYHILRFNDYEGFRLGLGLVSSDKLSRWVSLGGYGGYGFNDKAWKYGGDLKINFNRLKTTFIDIEAAHEVKETAGTQFLTSGNPLFDPSAYRDIMISKMDKIDFGRISFNTAIYRFIKLSAFFDVRQQTSPFGYIASDAIVSSAEQHTFNFNTTGLQLRIWPGEKFTESMGKLMSSGSKWPVFYVNLSRGLTTSMGQYSGQFDFTKIDLRIEQKLPFKIKGYLWYELQAGKVFGNVPYSLQYNNKGSRANAYALSVENTMETMYLNEFTSTQYAAVFLSLNSGQFLKPYRYSRPEIELVHNYVIGNISNPSQLAPNVPLKDLSKGYTEAGIRLRNILVYNFSGFGAGLFYRYGNYASPKTMNNLVIKLVFNFVL